MVMKTLRSKMLVYKRYPVSILLFWIIALSNNVNADAMGQKTMNSNSVCQQTSLKKSQEMIQFILNNLTETYTQVGGGGITEIKLIATNTFVVSISQEERIDQITYELEVDQNCKITILNRKVSAVTPWEK